MSLKGQIGFLSAKSDKGGRELSWIIILQSENKEPPLIQVSRRVLKGGVFQADDKRSNRTLTLTEEGDGGATAEGGPTLQLQLKLPPKIKAGLHLWEVKMLAAPARFPTKFDLQGAQGGALTGLSSAEAHLKQRIEVGSDGEIVKKFKIGDFPRLCLGINQARPAPPPTSYRNLTPGGTSADGAATGDAGALRALMYRIFVLLDSPGTLDPAWDQQSGFKTSLELTRAKLTVDPVRVAEEKWARQVTEMLSFVVYGNPSVRYRGTGRADAAFDSDGVAPGTSNPCYGLAMACQNLATFSTVTRLNLHQGSPLVIGAGAWGAAEAVKLGAQWFSGDESDPQPVIPRGDDPVPLGGTAQTVDITAGIAKAFRDDAQNGGESSYGAGALHLFSNRPARNDPAKYEAINRGVFDADYPAIVGTASAVVDTLNDAGDPVKKEMNVTVTQDLERTHVEYLVNQAGTHLRGNQDNPHVGFAMRVKRHPTDASKHRAQMFDTGGFSVPRRGDNLNLGTGVHSGIFDGPATKTLKNLVHPYRGFGLFKRLDRNRAEALHQHVEDVLERARPLGFARLALLERRASDSEHLKVLFAAKAFVYVSPLLTMYLPAADATSQRSNYSISRYAWSLRDLPGADELEARWYIYQPVRGLAKTMLDAPRTLDAIALAKATSGKPPAETLLNQTVPIGELISTTTGNVRIDGSIVKNDTRALFLLRNEFPMDQAFFRDGEAQLPDYFKPTGALTP